MKVQSAETVYQRGDLARKACVIVPLHNYADLIEQTLDTVAAQTFSDLALIVVDDGSTDASRAVAERWMRNQDAPNLGLALLANTSNAGLSVTRNTGIAYARSEYCFFLDADNLVFPRCVEKHVRALDARRDCIGAYSIVEEFGGIQRLIGANVFSRERLKRGNYIDAMVMLRRSEIERLDGFHPMRHGWEDFELWLRLCEAGERLLHIPQVLSRYRNHPDSMLRQQTNVGNNILELTRHMAQLHPWVTLDAPQPQRHTSGQPQIGLRKAIKLPAGGQPAGAYKQYETKILSKIEAVAEGRKFPVNVEIDTDYTGPAHGTPFDSFLSPRQRQDTEKQIRRMLQFGIAAINPRPGVHAARQRNGELTRYRSMAAEDGIVQHLPSSMLVHIHAFYPDVVEEMLNRFGAAAKHGRFLITTTSQKNHDAVNRLLDERAFSSHKTLLVENRGRNIGPFLDHALDYASDGDVICHVHTKKSPDVGESYGKKWRKSLYGALLTQTAIDAFKDDSLGLLFPDSAHCVGWGKNRAFCERIAESFGVALAPHPGPVPVGNMFFARTEVARAMRDATEAMDWPREPVPYDGTVLHAIERMWPAACEYAGLSWAAIYARHSEDDATT